MKQFLTLPAETLLDKFGSGKHAPGSGSAAALMGLLSAKLIKTVGQLTLAKKEYATHHQTILALNARLDGELVPRLKDLFQEDAEIFDRVIISRRARDLAIDEREKKRLNQDALLQLKAATAIPFKIAESCLELIDLSATTFDVGFRGARGDTGAALSSAVSGVLSAVFVINLNLKSFKGSYWARQRRRECDELQRIATEKYQAAMSRIVRLRTEDIEALLPLDQEEPTLAKLWEKISKRAGPDTTFTPGEIEQLASDVRTLVWRRQSEAWPPGTAPSDPVDLLIPSVALGLLGYNFAEVESLGTFPTAEGTMEVAGLLEAQEGRVQVSAQMKPPVRLFTAAHELGHVILHPHLKQAHRDRPLDGSSLSRDQVEREADTFASSYLMPPRLLRTRFRQTFGLSEISLSEEVAFALLGKDLGEAMRLLPTLRHLSRTIARANHFNGKQIEPLTEQFRVSSEAMAIRLEELRLVRADA